MEHEIESTNYKNMYREALTTNKVTKKQKHLEGTVSRDFYFCFFIKHLLIGRCSTHLNVFAYTLKFAEIFKYKVDSWRCRLYCWVKKFSVGNPSFLCFGLKGTVAPDIFILFMMSIIKSVLFVWPHISLIFFYSFINFIFVNKVLIYILPITLELAHISLKSLANLASAFLKVAGTLPTCFLKSLGHCQRVF